jgi:alkanesulfonate monooxygenase SsuD/methylene tetrahydromethanopterin reductase-like flavin-dependent oxidoreductase (luciferase family)
MRLGYMPDTHAAPYDAPHPDRDEVAEFYDELIETSKLAEDVGFDGLWVPDRHMRTETYWPSNLQLLNTLATVTEDIKLGSWANVLSLYNPMQVAEEVAVIDNLSKGRFVFVPAMGYHPGYWQYFGIDLDDKYGRYIDGLEVVKEAWDSSKEEPFSFDGKYHQFEDVYQSPDPYQDPRPPVWPGGQADAAIERAGQTGECWALDPFPLEEDTFKRQIDLYKESAAERGNDARIGLMRDAYVAPTSDVAEEVFGPIF